MAKTVAFRRGWSEGLWSLEHDAKHDVIRVEHFAAELELIKNAARDERLKVRWRQFERLPAEICKELFTCKGEELIRRIQALYQLWIWTVVEKHAFREQFPKVADAPASIYGIADQRSSVVDQVLQRVLKRKLPPDANLIEAGLRFCEAWSGMARHLLPTLMEQMHRHGSGEALPQRWREVLITLRDKIADRTWFSQNDHKLLRQLDELLGRGPELPLKSGQPWADAALADLAAMKTAEQSAWHQLMTYAAEASTSKPNAAWLKNVRPIVESLGHEAIVNALHRWLPLFGSDRVTRDDIYGLEYNDIDRPNRAIMLGLIWVLSEIGSDESVGMLARTAERLYRQTLPFWHPIAGACIRALSRMNRPEALARLSELELRLRKPVARKVAGKAMVEAAERQSIQPEDLAERTVPDFGLRNGVIRRDFTRTVAELSVPQRGKPAVRWITGDKTSRVAPKALREQHPEAAAQMKQLAGDIEKALDAQRHRLDRLMREDRSWPLAQWRELYLDHPLMSLLTRRLIWTIDGESAIWHEGAMVSRGGKTLSMAAKAPMKLWHPLHHPAEDVLAWRQQLETLGITQPIKQAHREIYVLTDAERQTRLYSNRFAAHILRNMLMVKLCQARGWKSGLYGGETGPRLIMPAFNVQAEFWVDVANVDDVNPYGMPTYVATDQVRFHPVGGDRRNPTVEPETLPLEQVEPLALSEAMRDVDLFVGVASVGNDPAWQDGGPAGRYRDYWHSYSFGDLSQTAETRKAVLERIVPRLKIAERCQMDGRFLIVRGDLRTYKIHLGSGNILMEPNDQYLCIVPGRSTDNGSTSGASGGGGGGGGVFLPFEGDQTLSVILSKAFLLANDRAIKDQSITSQIGRP